MTEFKLTIIIDFMRQLLGLLAWLSKPVLGLMFLLCTFLVEAQHSNIRITSVATSSGSWSLIGSTYVFTPTGDNANLNVTDLQNYLRGNSVEIKTSRAAGTQVGSVVFDVGVSVTKNSSSGSAFVFTINSGGEVQFNASMSLRANTNYTYTPGYNIVVLSLIHI